MRCKQHLLGFLPYIIIGPILIITSSCAKPSAEEALNQFYTYEGPEETLMDPLILAGDKVVPLVIDRVKNKDMPKRRYAIGFLGNGPYKEALQVLETLLHDSTERDVIRGDALISICQIDASLGLKYAERFKSDPGYQGEVSRDILSGKTFLPKRRSYADALAGKLSR